MSKAIVQSSVAERGPASAQFNLGVAYINGQGVEIKSNEMAREWWTKAAAQGDKRRRECQFENRKRLDTTFILVPWVRCSSRCHVVVYTMYK